LCGTDPFTVKTKLVENAGLVHATGSLVAAVNLGEILALG
jgi:hypothetical protein